MVAIITAVATIILIGLYTAVDILYSKQKQVFWIKNISFGVFYFFATFLITSGILFAAGLYSFWLCCGICALIGAVVVGVLFLRGREKTCETIAASCTRLTKGAYICLGALLVIGTVLTCSKFEYFGMGQDQGVYQVQAIYRTYGHNDIQYDFNSYNVLEDEDGDRQTYRLVISRIREYYWRLEYGTLLGNYPYDSGQKLYFEPLSDISGVMHGVPNHGAMLSISGRIFGVSGMWHVHTLFFLVSIVMLFLTLHINLGLKLSTSAVVSGIYAINPLLLWSTKSSLAEPFITLCIAVFVYLLTCRSPDASDASDAANVPDAANAPDTTLANTSHSKLLWIPVTAFAFYHVSVFAFMPMFTILFLFMYIYRRDKGYIFSGVVSLGAFIGGFFMMLFSANRYTFNNYGHLRNILPFGNLSYTQFVVFVVSVACVAIVLLVVCCLLVKRFNLKPNPKWLLYICTAAILLCGIYVVTKWMRAHFDGTLTPRDLDELRNAVSKSVNVTLYGYVFVSGFVMLPIACIGILFRQDIYRKISILPLVFMLLYCVFIYSVVMRFYVGYYYYYARYMAPFIIIILSVAAVYIDSRKLPVRVIAFSLCLCLTLPFTWFVFVNKDDTNMDWDTFEAVVEAVDALEQDDVVIVSKAAVQYFFMPLDYLTDTVILPNPGFDRMYTYVQDKLDGLSPGRVFLLSLDSNNERYTNFDSTFESADTLEFQTRILVYAQIPGLVPPLPMWTENRDLTIYLREVTDLSQLEEVRVHSMN